MINLPQSQWHMVAVADNIIERDGQIVGVVMEGVEHWFIRACSTSGGE